MHRRTQSGFSLIELLVAVAIITLLSSIILASTQVVRSRARDTRRISDIKQIQNALELFYTDNFSYPRSQNCGATIPSTGWCNSFQSLSDGHWIRDNGGSNLSNIISVLPTDPRPGASANWTPENGGTYFYYSGSGSNQWYEIVFGLENFPHALETQDGVNVGSCTTGIDDPQHWGTNNGVVTVGVDCP